MDYSEILASILEMYAEELKSSHAAQTIREKVENGIYRYEDAEDLAREISRILGDAFGRYLPEALTNGRLYREAADIVVRRPVIRGTQDVKDVAVRIQKGINQKNGLNFNAIVPEINEDQLTGIITGICNADSYEAGKTTLLVQVENFMEGYVDDYVQKNADFDFRSGLEPIVERSVRTNCCTWCSKLAGVYKYEDVRDKGNDVWRRHKNCHCTITYDPAGSKSRISPKNRLLNSSRESTNIVVQRIRNMDLQLFGRNTSEYREALFRENWAKASLKETVKRFCPGAKGVKSDKGTKIDYYSKDGRYIVVYDPKSDYFRIKDATINSRKKCYVNLEGKPMLNITINGKTRGTTKEEYEMWTHFKNTDKAR